MINNFKCRFYDQITIDYTLQNIKSIQNPCLKEAKNISPKMSILQKQLLPITLQPYKTNDKIKTNSRLMI